MYVNLVICAIVLTTCKCIPLPSNFQKCDRSQSDFNECLRAAIENALHQGSVPNKQFGIPVLEPLEIPSLVIGAGTGAVAFQQNYKNLKISGLSNLTCSEAKMDFEKKVLTVDCTSPQVIWSFEYEVNGKLLVLPISGTGPGTITMSQLNFKIACNLEEYEKKGKTYLRSLDQKLSLTPQLIHFDIKGLFGGDKVLGENMNQVMNENWMALYLDVNSFYEEALGRFFNSIFNNILKKVSLSELFGEEKN